MPLFYEEYAGSVNDVSRLQFMLMKAAAYGYKNAGFILDRGYFSEINVRFMDKNGFDFLIMVKGCKDLVNEAVLKHRGSFKDEWENAIPYYDVSGITVREKLFKKGTEDRYLHIYYSDYREAKERSKLNNEIWAQKEYLTSLIGTNTKIERGYTE